MDQVRAALAGTGGLSRSPDDTVNTIAAVRWCWFKQFVELLQEKPRDATFYGSLYIAAFPGCMSPSGRFVAFVAPKLQGINERTRIELRDLTKGAYTQSS
jgi:hypothetical protein